MPPHLVGVGLLVAQPQSLEMRIRVPGSLAQIAVERHCSFTTEGACARATTLAQHDDDALIEVDV